MSALCLSKVIPLPLDSAPKLNPTVAGVASSHPAYMESLGGQVWPSVPASSFSSLVWVEGSYALRYPHQEQHCLPSPTPPPAPGIIVTRAAVSAYQRGGQAVTFCYVTVAVRALCVLHR